VRLTSTIACPDFTAHLAGDRDVRTVRAGREELRRLPDGAATLEPGSWRKSGPEIAWCADLPAGEVTVTIG
jgi:hypothetical protein